MTSELSSELAGAAPSELPPALPCTRESIAAAESLRSPPPSRSRFVLRPQDPARAGELGRACAISPLIAQVLLNRGIAAEAPARLFLGPKLAHLTKPDLMADRALAAERLADAIRRGERIVVFGDYDVDGTTSAAVLSGILAQLGADVRTLLANRFLGGYGLSEQALDRCLAERPRVLVTCDCGSSDHARVERARASGVDVIVIDHHLVPAQPLAALAFLNPHRPQCGFPYKGLCSAGLALSVGAALRQVMKVDLDLRPWLDLVALGTIADVAPLDGDNRALVRAGLSWLTSDDARPGIVALRELAKLRPGAPISAVDVAFRMTPRLNAAGRLGDPTLTLQLLQARSLTDARLIALQIERINGERKNLERQATEAALGQLAACGRERAGLVAAGEGWHRGVVGISAARLVDQLARPALAIALDGELGHGSGRAPDGFPLHAALSRAAHLLEGFGGHDAAVGLTVRADRIEALREAFDQACAELQGELAHDPALDVDARIEGDEGLGYALPRASELGLLEPLGEGNPEPLFEVAGDLMRSEVVGSDHLKLAIKVGAGELGAFGFEMGAQKLALVGPRARVWGALRADTYRGGERVELRILHVEPDTSRS